MVVDEDQHIREVGTAVGARLWELVIIDRFVEDKVIKRVPTLASGNTLIK